MSYYTDCLYFCEGLSEKQPGIWPFKGKSEMDKCRDDCRKSGKYETQQVQFEEGFHRSGDLDVDIDADVSASATWGPSGPSFGGNGDSGYYDASGNYVPPSQGDPMLIVGALALIGGLILLGGK